MNGNAAASSSSTPLDHPAPNGIGSSTEKSQLVLPIWDIPPVKPLHPSHDLISLLSLAPLYNTYVRPYATAADEDNQAGVGDGEGGRIDQVGGVQGVPGTKGKGGQRQKGKGLEKGYTGLLDDCIDPLPDGPTALPTLLPLIRDISLQPTGSAPEVWPGPIEILPLEKWNVATLVVGSQSGYKGGVKEGVQKAEEKRQRKREARALALQGMAKAPPANANPLNPGPQSTPGTPLLPVPPPSRGGINGFSARRQDSASGIGTNRPPPINPATGAVPGPSSGSAARSATFRPSGAAARPSTPGASAQPGGVKRVYEGQGAGMSKKAKVAGTRSASPMPGSSLAKAGDGKTQGQGKAQARPGVGKAGRAKTEGM